MAFVNLKKKEIQVKIVYYGPGRGGKTTNLEFIYNKFNHRIRTEMVTIKTHGDRTLFFDFLPFDIGKITFFQVPIKRKRLVEIAGVGFDVVEYKTYFHLEYDPK